MRIIAGRWRGKQLAGPKDARVRPTTDRVKEALFNVLAHAPWAPEIAGARVLDLFAGSGALGLEALSRGAHWVCLVDNHAESRALVRRNIEALGATGATKLFSRSATDLGPMPAVAGGPFALVFCDPPYGSGLGPAALASARAGGWLADGALCILELDKGEDVPEIEGFETLDDRTYGETRLLFLTAA